MAFGLENIFGEDGIKTDVKLTIGFENETFIKLGAAMVIAGLGVALSYFTLKAIFGK